MIILEKIDSKRFNGFDWLNFESLSKSDGFKFEVYFPESDDRVSQSIVNFYRLFKNFLSDIVVNTFKSEGKWGNFCLDTWDIEHDTYDYSPLNKQEPTASYLAMLNDSEIEPEYSGFCKCLDWDKFLYITLHCVMQHTAPYSLMFYVPNQNFVFYFHHSGSLGIYYKELNADIVSIVQKTKEENLAIENFNDERILALIN